MNKKIRILIIVGILLIVAIITKFALADSNEEGGYTTDQIKELGKEAIPVSICYKNGMYKINNLKDGQYPLTAEEIEELQHRYTKGDASTVEADATDSEVIEQGIINSADAIQILKWYCHYSLLEEGTPSKAKIFAGDVDSDGDIDQNDAVIVLKYISAALLGEVDSLKDFIEQEEL